MSRIAPQLAALFRLSRKSWLAPPPNRASRGAGAGGVGLLALRALGLLGALNLGFNQAHAVTATRDGGLAGAVVLATGAWLYAVVTGIVAAFAPRTGVFDAPLFDALPVYDGVRAVLTAATSFLSLFAHVAFVSAMVTLSLASRGAGPWLVALALASLAVSMSAALLGFGAGRLLRVHLSGETVARLSLASGVMMLVPLLFVLGAPLASASHRLEDALTLPGLVLRVWLDESPIVPALLAVGVFAGGLGLTVWAERAVWEVLEVPARTSRARPAKGALALGSVDRVQNAREPGLGLSGALPVLVTVAAVVAILIARFAVKRSAMPSELLRGVLVTVGFVSLFPLMTHLLVLAERMAARDLAARPFLSTLPAAPRDLLRGKLGIARRRVYAVVVPLACLVTLPEVATNAALLARAAMVFAAVLLAAHAVVYIAFLRASAGRVGLEHLVVTIPLFAVAGAPSGFSAVVSLASLGLVVYAARLAATRAVEWAEDPTETHPSVWRALIALAAFHAVQSLAGGLLHGVTGDAAVQGAIAYVVSAAFLVGWTAKERPPGFSLLGASSLAPSLALAIGLAAGALSGGVALAYLRALHAFGVSLPALPSTTSLGRAGLAAVAIAIAPLAEEAFFRGWMQRAVRFEWTGDTWLAPVLTALFFASVHPPLAFPAVFVLGLVTGVLFRRTGGVVAGMAAHVVHNLVAVLLA